MIWFLLYLFCGLTAGRIFYHYNREYANGSKDDRTFLQAVTWLTLFFWPISSVVGAGYLAWWFMTARPEQALPFRLEPRRRRRAYSELKD